jgi:hypothetical protein
LFFAEDSPNPQVKLAMKRAQGPQGAARVRDGRGIRIAIAQRHFAILRRATHATQAVED